MADLTTSDYLQIAGTVLNAGGSFAQSNNYSNYGDSAVALGKFKADQLRERAGQVIGASQRQAADVDLQAKYTASRAIALAAAGGGGVSDPTIQHLMANNAQEAAYRKSLALYQGNDQARVLNLQATSAEYEGQLAKQKAQSEASAMSAKGGAGILSGASSLFKAFGSDSPAATDAGVANAAGWADEWSSIAGFV